MFSRIEWERSSNRFEKRKALTFHAKSVKIQKEFFQVTYTIYKSNTTY